MVSRKPYQGRERKLILSFDVGTTYSGVSYCILDPGEIPEIRGVARYPAQEQVGGDRKIPSILYYDQQHVVQAVGAEALQQHIIEQAEDENWIKVKWWKLHLRPKHLWSAHVTDDDIPPLPKGLAAVQVLSDFMEYLFKCARTYIIESHASGDIMWKSLENHIEFVLTHPNGWEGPQQQQIRRAAESAGLIPKGEDGQSRLRLLTEGEASLHFCVTTVLAEDSLGKTPILCPAEPEEPNVQSDYQGVAIIDAGGGTIDMSIYSMKLSPSVSVEEIATAECRLQGSVYVTLRAQQFLKSKLANSKYGTDEMIEQMTEIFDRTTKLRFRNAADPQYILFGTVRDKDPDYNIRSGQLRIAGAEVAKFFEPSVEAIAETFKQQQRSSSLPIKHAFLVGGYGSSDFLFYRLQQHPAFSDVSLCRPGQYVNKAVADGAVSFYIDHLVIARVAKVTYGAPCKIDYQPHLAGHVTRRSTGYRDIDGNWVLPNSFGTRVSEEQQFRQILFINSETRVTSIFQRISAYRGSLLDPQWTDEEPDSFKELCTIRADVSRAANALCPQTSPDGNTYYQIAFDVIILFGLTELKAQISWMENVCDLLVLCYNY
ncbi:hypothetical protein ID866_6155 [Astraeus odoratus]|nr:hypothetical protein ID866_6155 [Astraeus odoratus]